MRMFGVFVLIKASPKRGRIVVFFSVRMECKYFSLFCCANVRLLIQLIFNCFAMETYIGVKWERARDLCFMISTGYQNFISFVHIWRERQLINLDGRWVSKQVQSFARSAKAEGYLSAKENELIAN